ncbi:nucleotide exchange factor GrpE [bacterium]|nr:nucleotide exchange factor GrpE [bacterium]
MVENKNEQTVADTEQTSTQALEACQAEVAAWKDRCMRTMADFQNYQQRSEKERVLWMDKAQERVLKDVLSLFDDVDVKEFAAYEQFDPELHEAITFVSAQGKQSGFVVDVFQKGFMYKDQVLRIAKVSVAQ